MLWDFVLFSILVATAYWGIHFWRRRPFGSRTFGAMMLGTAALSALALAGRSAHMVWGDAVAVIAIGVAAVQLVIAPLVRSVARWAVATDRLRLAAVLVDLRDALQPGMGGRDDKRMVAALRDVKEGRVDGAVAALDALRERAPAGARHAIDERVILLLLSAQRWQDAIARADATLLAEDRGGPLPVSPSIFVELVTARLRVGDLEGATALAERFEQAAAGVTELSLVVYRLHLVFLAHLGRVAAVDRLLEPRLASYVSPAARRYWAGVARHAAGDRDGARAALHDARGLAGRDRRARALIDEVLADLDRPAPEPTPRALALADAMAAAPIQVPPRAPGRGGAVTAALVVGNLVVAAFAALALAGAGDFGSVVRVGANARSLVLAGEPWRLASSVFVHVGLVHLIVNVLALWSLGRLVEGLFGRARTLAIYGVAGVAGALASHLAATAPVSAGASGAIFGLLGASTIELALHRVRYRKEWRRSLLGALIVVTVAQLGIGFAWSTVIDQWAHVGGLAAGVAMGALLSPGWRWAEHRAVVWSARGVAATVAVIFAGSAIAAAATDYGDSLRRQGRRPLATELYAVDAPTTWTVDGLHVGDFDLNVTMMLEPAVDLDELGRLGDTLAGLARARGFGGVAPADRLLRVPSGWATREWTMTGADPLGSAQHYRAVAFVGPVGDELVLGLLIAPEVLFEDARGELEAIVRSIRRAP